MNRRNALKTALATVVSLITRPLSFEQPATRISGRQGALVWRAGYGKLIIEGESIFHGDVELDGEVEFEGDVTFMGNLTIGQHGIIVGNHTLILG